MNIMEKIRKLLKNDNSKKFITNLSIFLIIGIMILIVASTFTGEDKKDDGTIGSNTTVKPEVQNTTNDLINDYASGIEKNLESILSKIKGIGEVHVMVTLADTAERIPAIDTTESKETTKEKDAQGGIREVFKDDRTNKVVTSSNSGTESLVVIKEVKPEVKGVVVVAEGVGDPVLKEKVYRAVKTVLGVPGNRVEVFSSN